MQVKVYWNSLVLGLRQVTNYRGEMWFQLLTKLLSLGGLVMLWYILLKDDPKGGTNELVGYLLIANGVRELFDAFYMKNASFIMEAIKTGELSALLLRPINPYGFLFFNFQGTRGTNLIFALVSIIGGIVVSPPKSVLGGILFGGATTMGLILGFCFNVLVAELAFWFVQAGNIRTAIVHMTKVLSGSMVPLYFFPVVARNIVMMSPFPLFAYLPTRLLQGDLATINLISLGSQVIWVLVAIKMMDYFWKKGLKRYEAVGI